MRGPLKRNGLDDPGPIANGQRVTTSWLNDAVRNCIRRIIPGPGIQVSYAGQDAIVSCSLVAPSTAGGSVASEIVTAVDKTALTALIASQGLTSPRIGYTTSNGYYYALVTDSAWICISVLE